MNPRRRTWLSLRRREVFRLLMKGAILTTIFSIVSELGVIPTQLRGCRSRCLARPSGAPKLATRTAPGGSEFAVQSVYLTTQRIHHGIAFAWR